MKDSYLEAIKVTERLHRQFLDLVKAELDRLGVEDINNVQAVILFNVGPSELSVGELTGRGYYLGSNVSYNLRKMAESGYIAMQRSPHDRRSVRVRLSDKGQRLYEQLDAMVDRQVNALSEIGATDALDSAANAYLELERLWIRWLEMGARSPRD